LGLSYAPSSKSNGLTKNIALDVDQTVMRNIFSGSISYLEDFDNLFLAISAGAEKANAKNSRADSNVERADLLAYDLGLTASYFGVSLGLSYGIWKDYLQAKNGAYSCDYNPSLTLAAQNCSHNAKKFSKPYYASAALSYEFGPFGTSLSALKSEFEKNKYYVISFDLDYKISKNVKTYFEATRFAFNSNQPTASDISNQDSIANSQRQLQNNRGYVFLTGILFSF
jgi:predicted porin